MAFRKEGSVGEVGSVGVEGWEDDQLEGISVMQVDPPHPREKIVQSAPQHTDTLHPQLPPRMPPFTTRQALWYYVQPPLEALRLVAGLCAEASARGLRGAPLLDLLHDRAARSFGDARAHALLTRLLRAAAAPYFAMLARWVGEGELADPCGEFLVQEDAVRLGAGIWGGKWGGGVGQGVGQASVACLRGGWVGPYT